MRRRRRRRAGNGGKVNESALSAFTLKRNAEKRDEYDDLQRSRNLLKPKFEWCRDAASPVARYLEELFRERCLAAALVAHRRANTYLPSFGWLKKTLAVVRSSVWWMQKTERKSALPSIKPHAVERSILRSGRCACK